jgi:peptide/nickel transport system substrate-binding protein
MSDVGVPSGHPRHRPATRRPRARRPVALLTTGVLALPVLTGCGGSGDEQATGAVKAVAADLAAAQREQVADGGTLGWAVDTLPATFNAFQADADTTTARIAGAVLPALFVLDDAGRPQRNPDFLEDASIIEREPKQVVLYKINQQAVWSDGRQLGAADFVAQWRALHGGNSAFWTARNAGYERIEKIEKGADHLEVRVTYAKPYADWRSLFTPLYPKEVMGSPDAFNDGARGGLRLSAGPFRPVKLDREDGSVLLERNPRWWGRPAKLDRLVLREVPRNKRASALAAGRVDLAEIDRDAAERIARAAREGGKDPLTHGPGSTTTPAEALRSWARAHGAGGEEQAEAEQRARAKARKARQEYAAEQRALRGVTVRKSLEAAYTQLALNGTSGPLADERVRRAVARALDRHELAEAVLKPLGLPAAPLGSHLALAGQDSYADGSGALGGQDTGAAHTLLAEAGWTRGNAARPPESGHAGSRSEEEKSEEEKKERAKAEDGGGAAPDEAPSDEGLYIVGDEEKGDDGKSGDGHHSFRTEPGIRILAPASGPRHTLAAPLWHRPYADGGDRADGKTETRRAEAQEKQRGGMAGAYAPRGTAAPRAAGDPATGSAQAPRLVGRNGKPLTLRFVLPADPGSAALRTVGARISRMLESVGVTTEIVKVKDASYFKDHIASGDYDLALYSWPGTAYPATDGRPIFAKPRPAADGSLLVEQNYTRVGTDHIDQLFDQATAELDEEAARELVRKADARIWAAAGSIPLYQRPELVAARKNVVNAGAFGFSSPRYQDIGFKKPDSAKDERK